MRHAVPVLVIGLCGGIGAGKSTVASLLAERGGHVIDVDAIGSGEDLKQRIANSGVTVSGLGFYPNSLAEDESLASAAVEHIRRVISGCAQLDIPVMNPFIGRNPSLSIDENWGRGHTHPGSDPAIAPGGRPLGGMVASLRGIQPTDP